MTLKPEDLALIERVCGLPRVMTVDDRVSVTDPSLLAALLAAAREESRPDARPSHVGREEVARVIASALGDHFDHAFANKAEWNRASGENGGRYRDINEPMQDDYLAAADAILALFSPVDGWKPIETAPKDGTEVLAFRPDQGVFIARWAWMEEVVPRDQNGDPIEDYDDSFADWWHDAWGWLERELAPTHWQPLPAAPPPPGGQG